jgi:hypothetical protein
MRRRIFTSSTRAGRRGLTLRIGTDDRRLPRCALRLVLDWAELHQNELQDNWTLAQQRKPIKTISPLE